MTGTRMEQVTRCLYHSKFKTITMNRKNNLIILLAAFLISFRAQAQLEKVFVETYYISDSYDAADTYGGYLENGSTTYRIYVDLVKGSKVQKIYGDVNHALKFSSSGIFFNNIADGQSFAKDMSKNRLGENTVALDSWLTLGQTTKSISKVFGTPKNQDDDGSFVGGVNNDGGSTSYSLLTNSDPLAGIPLTTSDGNDTMSTVPLNWFDYGIIDGITDEDSTIFGSLKPDSVFVSYNCGLQNSGVSGVVPDSNHVLVAQLTVKGELHFAINLEVIDTSGNVLKYVASDSVLLADEIFSRYLTYPFEQKCGCPDPDYLEYATDRDCDNADSCQHLIVFGCMDPMSCNYDAAANVNVPSLCCYPGRCNDRDIALVCPQLVTERRNGLEFSVFPNPSASVLNVQSANDDLVTRYVIYNSVGQKIIEQSMDQSANSFSIDISTLKEGIYMIRIFNNDENNGQMFAKE